MGSCSFAACLWGHEECTNPSLHMMQALGSSSEDHLNGSINARSRTAVLCPFIMIGTPTTATLWGHEECTNLSME